MLENEIVPEKETHLNQIDILIGLITEPSHTCSVLSRGKVSTFTYILPVLLYLLLGIITLTVFMTNPIIKEKILTEKVSEVEVQFQEMVEAGKMSQAEADKQLEKVSETINNPFFTIVLPAAGQVFFVFLIFFLIAGVLHLIVKFLLGGQGSYISALTAYGLSYYILCIQTLVIVIASVLTGRPLTGINAVQLLDMDKMSVAGFFLSRLDPLVIWYYFILSFALARFYRSENIKNYLFVIFGLWFTYHLVVFILAQIFPFLKNLVM